MSDPKDVAGVIAPPPFLFGGTLAAGLLLNRIVEVPFVPRGLSRLAGPVLTAKGVVLAAWAMRTMKAAGTHIDVNEPATALVESGPFAYTRNPIYTALTLVYAGIATWRRAPVALALLAPLLCVLERGVVEREEEYLEGKFGDDYVAYKSRVRRWF
jgi:protein-S-isoprenylcysteine O-methyltransferase Ste14